MKISTADWKPAILVELSWFFASVCRDTSFN